MVGVGLLQCSKNATELQDMCAPEQCSSTPAWLQNALQAFCDNMPTKNNENDVLVIIDPYLMIY